MKERPILFKGAMVRAILDGSKTQTRRIMNPQPKPTPADYPGTSGHWWPSNAVQSMVHIEEQMQQWTGLAGDCCPYGDHGDQLWVRETHSIVPDHDEPAGCSAVLYQADGGAPYGKWKPSIHMFREHSGIQLEIVSVRVERLQAISVEDALAEGITHRTMNDPRVEYQHLWEDINGAGSWDVNPWVWVVEFKRAK
jgi:uncharacterized protein YhfF